MHKVSVVTGTWNRFEMVCQMIESALQQTYPVHEIIVVDDCSPDGSYDRLLEKYKDQPLVKIFRQEKNTGGVPNWNRAVDLATGDFIAWCSDDDQLFCWHIEKSMQFFEQHPEVDMVHAAFANSFETGMVQRGRIDASILGEVHVNPTRSQQPIIIRGRQILPYYTKYYNWPFHPSTLVFKKEVWKNVGPFNPEYELADSEWFIKVVLSHTVAYLPHLGVLNRRHGNNWSNAMGSVKMQVEVNNMMQRAVQRLRPDCDDPAFRRDLRSWKWNYEQVLFRIFVSRVRHGMPDVALQAREALNKSSAIARLVLHQRLLPFWMKGLGVFKKKNFDLSPR